MPTRLKQVADAIEKIAPLALAQDWDNVGLLVGDENKNIKNILLTIDITCAVVEEAKKHKTDLILSYHPVIWDGLKSITTSTETAHIVELIRSKISVFSIHTAFDVAAGGVNDQLAEIVGIETPKPIGDYVENPQGSHFKVVVFVPTDAINDVAEAMFSAGAGSIGNYSKCSFRSEGQGTFLPMQGAKPAIGSRGKLEKVNEIKLESIVPESKVPAVVAAMRNAHPYEMPAFDVFRHYDLEGKLGLGRVGKLKKPRSMASIIENIKQVTGVKAIGIVGKEKRTVKKAAVCAGSCGKLISSVIAENCDLYLTGELKHHQALAAQEANLTCICLSHTVSERFALKNLAKSLKKHLNNVTIRLSKKDADPFKWKNI